MTETKRVPRSRSAATATAEPAGKGNGRARKTAAPAASDLPPELAESAAESTETAGDGKKSGKSPRPRSARPADLLALNGIGWFPALAEYRYMEKAVYRQYDMDATRTGLPKESFLGRVRFFLDDKGEPAEHVEPLMRGTLTVNRFLRLRDIIDRNSNASNQSARPGRPGDTHGELVEMTFLPPDPSLDGITALIDFDEFDRTRDLTWTRALGMQGFYDPRDLPEIKTAVLAMVAKAPVSDTYGKTGILTRDGLPDVWVRFGRPALLPAGGRDQFDDSAMGMVPPEYSDVECLSMLTYADPSTPETAREDAEALLDLMNVWPDQAHIPAALLAELSWSPWSFAFGRIAVVVTGKSADFAKTTLAGQAIAYQSGVYVPSPALEPPVVDMRGQGTALGLTQAIHAARGAVVCADDMITKHMTAAELARQVKIIDGVVSQVRTGRGHPRGGHRNGRTTVSVSKAPTGCLLITLEELPNESRLFSLVGRAAVLRTRPVTDPEAWSARMTRAQKSAPAAARALAGYIAWALGDWRERADSALSDARKVTTGWRAKYGGHKNTVKTYAALLAGAWMLTEYARSVGTEPPFDMAGLLETAFAEQARRSGEAAGETPATDPERVFATAFRALLSSGRMYLSHPELNPMTGYSPPDAPPAELIRCGWKARRDSVSGAVDWEHPAGAPVGAVAVYVPGPGKPPVYPRRILVGTADWEQVIVPAVRAWSQDQDGILIPDGPELRDVLVRSRMMHRADAKDGAPEFLSYSNRARRYVLDFDRVVMGAGESEPGPGDETATLAEAAAGSVDQAVTQWVDSALSAISAMTADQLDQASITTDVDRAERDGNLSVAQAESIRAARIRRLRELSGTGVQAPLSPVAEFVAEISDLIASAATLEDLRAIDWAEVRDAVDAELLAPERVTELREAYSRKARTLAPAPAAPAGPAPAVPSPRRRRPARATLDYLAAVHLVERDGMLVPDVDGPTPAPATLEGLAGFIADHGPRMHVPAINTGGQGSDGMIVLDAPAARTLGLDAGDWTRALTEPARAHGLSVGRPSAVHVKLWRHGDRTMPDAAPAVSVTVVNMAAFEQADPKTLKRIDLWALYADRDGRPDGAQLARLVRAEAASPLGDVPLAAASGAGMRLLEEVNPREIWTDGPDGKRVRQLRPDALPDGPTPAPVAAGSRHPMTRQRQREGLLICSDEDFAEWRREPTDAEAELPYVIAIDRNLAFLAGARDLQVPIGNLEPVESYRGTGIFLADFTALPVEPDLPHFARMDGAAPDRPYYYTSPTIEYAIERYGFDPSTITEGFATDQTSALLHGFSERVRDGYLSAMESAGVARNATGAEFLAQYAAAAGEGLILAAGRKMRYKAMIGRLADTGWYIRPAEFTEQGRDQAEREWLETVASKWSYRPDVRLFVVSASRIGTHRMISTAHKLSGRAPLAVNVDSVLYPADTLDPLSLATFTAAGRPAGIRFGMNPGSCKPKSVIPMDAYRSAPERRLSVNKLINAYDMSARELESPEVDDNAE